LLMAALVLVRAGPVAYLGVAAFALHLAWQVRRIDPDDERLALKLFRSNRDAGLILFAGLTLAALLGAA
jgi:4-hydroxybenzoate polyprenyltransferase